MSLPFGMKRPDSTNNKKQQRAGEIVATNRTPSIDKLLEMYPAARYGYSVRMLAPGQYSIAL